MSTKLKNKNSENREVKGESGWESALDFLDGMIGVVEKKGRWNERYWMVYGEREWLMGALAKLRWKMEEEERCRGSGASIV